MASKNQILGLIFCIAIGLGGGGYGVYSGIMSSQPQNCPECIECKECPNCPECPDCPDCPSFPEDITIPTYPTNSVFVAKWGDDILGNGNRTIPFCTIQHALEVAETTTTKNILIGMGYYEESIVDAASINLLGGYSTHFGLYSLLNFRPRIFSTTERFTLKISGVSTSTIVEGLEIRGPLRTQDNVGSYAIYVSDCSDQLEIRNCTIIGGQAGSGPDGSNGINGAAGVNGGQGVNARNATSPTDNSPGGVKGNNVYGYDGGTGGGVIIPLYDREESDGAAAESGGGVGGDAGEDGAFFIDKNTLSLPSSGHFMEGNPGFNGVIGASGAGGVGASSSLGSVVSGFWIAIDGGDGTDGTCGRGGGGGGAGGGIENPYYNEPPYYYPNQYGFLGATGGGGGGGGQNGARGEGGSGGGGCFAIFIYLTTPGPLPLLNDNEIYLGIAGNGGTGGMGGVGGNGGNGGAGGLPGVKWPLSGCGFGGRGGQGGSGGHGGGGGGGAGGMSCGIYVYHSGAYDPNYDIYNTIHLSSGRAGFGGGGGISLGNYGIEGIDGLLLDIQLIV